MSGKGVNGEKYALNIELQEELISNTSQWQKV
jgi:hypothetical protein